MDSAEKFDCQCRRGGRGPSSFWMHEPDAIFGELDLKPGDIFLDLGCGNGDYSICAAEEVGDKGTVYAADIREDLIDSLLENAEAIGLNNIMGVIVDISEPLPFEDGAVDLCFISTVLHSIDLKKYGDALFHDIRRILKPEGRLVIIECKKEEMQFGPPLRMRLSPGEIEGYTSPCGFKRTSFTDLGYNYMICLSPEEVMK